MASSISSVQNLLNYNSAVTTQGKMENGSKDVKDAEQKRKDLEATIKAKQAEVKELTQDKIQITEGALYPTLHSLEADGLVTTVYRRHRTYICLTEPKDAL